jgi:hypothetical protein
VNGRNSSFSEVGSVGPSVSGSSCLKRTASTIRSWGQESCRFQTCGDKKPMNKLSR